MGSWSTLGASSLKAVLQPVRPMLYLLHQRLGSNLKMVPGPLGNGFNGQVRIFRYLCAIATQDTTKCCIPMRSMVQYRLSLESREEPRAPSGRMGTASSYNVRALECNNFYKPPTRGS